MTTLPAGRLHRLLTLTLPHVGHDDAPAALRGVHLDADGTVLHAVATDRFTLAVARADLVEPRTSAWARTIPEADLPWLITWLEAQPGDTLLTLIPGDGTLALALTDGTVQATAPTRGDAWPASWRNVVRTALTTAASENPLTNLASLNPHLLSRFQHAGFPLQVWQPTPGTPLIVLGQDYIGLQMPMSRGSQLARPDIDAAIADWSTSLGAGPRAEILPPRPTPELVDTHDEELLRQTLHALDEAADTTDLTLHTAWHLVAIGAWTSRRLLEALRTTDPARADAVIRDLTEDIQDGEIEDLAHAAAKAAGYDPDAWQEQHTASTPTPDKQTAA